MNFLGMGPMEVIIVLLVAFIFLGPQRMVEAAKLLGKGMNELRRLTAELPRLDLDDEDLIVSNGKPSTSPGKEAYRSESPRDSEQREGASLPQVGATSDEQSEETPVAFSRGAPARTPDTGETTASEETN